MVNEPPLLVTYAPSVTATGILTSTLPALAVTVVFPTATPVTRPSDATVAIAVDADVQVVPGDEITTPLASFATTSIA
jgi:hypothetical protein